MFLPKSLNEPNAFAVFDGHALYLVRVPHGTPIETNGVVLAECTPRVTDEYLEMLSEQVLRRNAPKSWAEFAERSACT